MTNLTVQYLQMEMLLQQMGINKTFVNVPMENLTMEDINRFLQSLNLTKMLEIDMDKYLQEPVTIILIILCIMALCTNVLSILATTHVPSNLFTAHFRLILSLAASDIFTVFSVVVHIMNKALNPPLLFHMHTKDERLLSACGFQFVVSLNVTAHLISLLNLFAMAQDHYVAIMKPLHYNQIMTSSRVKLMIVALWGIAILGGFSNFYAGLEKPPELEKFNMCERALYSNYQAEYLLILLTVLCFLGITVIYITLYSKIKAMDKFPVAVMSKNKMHNKKALVTTLLIIGTFGICWLPDMFFELAMIIQVHVDASKVKDFLVVFVQANNYLYILLLCNSLFDPIIYAIRLKEVQLGYISFLSKHSTYFRRMLHQRRLNRQSSQSMSTEHTRTSVVTNSDHRNSASLLGKKTNTDEETGDFQKLVSVT